MRRLILNFLLLASAAQANIMTQTAFVENWADPLAQWGSAIALPFHQFDPTLGELTDVRVTASADIGMRFASWPIGSPYWLIMQDTLDLPLGSAYRVFSYFDPTGVSTNPVDTTLKITKSGSMPPDLTRFIGSTMWSFNVHGGVFVYSQTPAGAPLPAGELLLRNLSVEINYDYIPVAAVEPRYAGLVLLVIAIAAIVTRRTLLGRRASHSLELD